MRPQKWQLLSVVVIGVLVFFLSIPSSDNSIRGIYDGNNKSEVLKEFPPLTGILYSVQEYQTNQFAVKLSPFAYFVFALFWVLFDGVSLLLFGWIPAFFARLHKWFRVSIGILLSVIFVPALLFTILSLLNGSETFHMFTDFGIHRYHSFGIDLSGAIITMLRMPIWTIFLAVPNVILLIVCILKGKDSWFMQSIHN